MPNMQSSAGKPHPPVLSIKGHEILTLLGEQHESAVDHSNSRPHVMKMHRLTGTSPAQLSEGSQHHRTPGCAAKPPAPATDDPLVLTLARCSLKTYYFSAVIGPATTTCNAGATSPLRVASPHRGTWRAVRASEKVTSPTSDTNRAGNHPREPKPRRPFRGWREASGRVAAKMITRWAALVAKTAGMYTTDVSSLDLLDATGRATGKTLGSGDGEQPQELEMACRSDLAYGACLLLAYPRNGREFRNYFAESGAIFPGRRCACGMKPSPLRAVENA